MLQTLTFLSDDNRHEYTMTLDGVQFELVFTYRERRASWYFDLFDADGTALVRGRRCSPGYPLVAAGVAGRPAGILTADGPDPYSKNEIRIIYYPEATLTEAAAAE